MTDTVVIADNRWCCEAPYILDRDRGWASPRTRDGSQCRWHVCRNCGSCIAVLPDRYCYKLATLTPEGMLWLSEQQPFTYREIVLAMRGRRWLVTKIKLLPHVAACFRFSRLDELVDRLAAGGGPAEPAQDDAVCNVPASENVTFERRHSSGSPLGAALLGSLHAGLKFLPRLVRGLFQLTGARAAPDHGRQRATGRAGRAA